MNPKLYQTQQLSFIHIVQSIKYNNFLEKILIQGTNRKWST